MTAILAVDPGTFTSALVELDGDVIGRKLLLPNPEARAFLRDYPDKQLLAIEYLQCYGMAVGKDVFETATWIGRFVEVWGEEYVLNDYLLVYRQTAKIHLCGSSRAKDPNVRQALIDLWGGDAKAIGGKKCPTCKGKCSIRVAAPAKGRGQCPSCARSLGWEHPPGPLKGFAAHSWAALAVAVVVRDKGKAAGFTFEGD